MRWISRLSRPVSRFQLCGLAFPGLALLALALGVTACAGGPGAYGITGPGAQQGAPISPSLAGTSDPSDAAQPVPGVSTTGTFYGPNYGPTTNSTGYYGYN